MLLNAIHWSPDPIIIDLGGFALRWYSTLFAIGFVISYTIIHRVNKAEGGDPDLIDKMLIHVVLGTVLGARLGYCVFYEPEMFVNNPLGVILPVEFSPEFRFTGFSGLASHGGTIGIIIAMALLSWRTGKSTLWYLDKMAMVTALGGMCIRLGNLMNSEIVGTETTVAWGFIFERHNAIEGLAEGTVLHPVQLYEAIGYFFLFLFMMRYYKRNYGKVRDGHMLGVFLALLFTIRYVLEFVKETYLPWESDFVRMGQILSVPFILVGIYLAYSRRNLKEKEAES
ncbi:MAG: prolipoprotein diacylglyceryl transferase [Saprospiraceae bacterium]|nr:prolipoprotein diacylglyceryl transferase [Saprospiraceae bacterium]